jgi:ketosteroid isomerase-like protein
MNMKKLAALLLCASMCLDVFCQPVQKEINEQVWKPFVKSFNEYKAEDFLSVHSKDVIRSARDGKTVFNWEQYLQSHAAGDKRDVLAKTKRTLSLRFTERVSNESQAIDVGIYQVLYQLNDGTRQSYYGRFHVALRKENDRWKILVDTDSSEGGKIGEADFLVAKPMIE